jgi:cupin 2 domain-containing protein
VTTTRNLLEDLPRPAPEEDFETLLQRPGVKLERIVSHGHTTPEAEWYDQEQDEWVMLLAGAARLLIEGQGERPLAPGDALLLPAHCRHRVTWTDPDRPTVWLALHLAAAPGAGAEGE